MFIYLLYMYKMGRRVLEDTVTTVFNTILVELDPIERDRENGGDGERDGRE